ncbi:MAG: hypothetical protein K2I08_09945 [Muribaculaceae bacterium]|nr:hypothetical protein [Muribaculaceae bacterium]
MKNNAYSTILLLLLGAVIWWMSANVVWLGDDLDYKYMMKGEIWQSWGWIKSLKDFFLSQTTHYHNVNGRFIAHALVQLFNGILGQQVFAVVNAIIYALFAIFIGLTGYVRISKNSGGILTAVCLSVMCFITKMMPTCQIGYIWGMLVNIIWLRLFFRFGKPSWTATVAIALLGIIVGNWQESVSLGVCSGVGAWWIMQLIKSIKYSYERFDWRRSWMLAGYVAGTATNCFAPSTIGRVGGDIMPFLDQLLIASYSIPGIIILILVAIANKKSINNFSLFSFDSIRQGIPNGVLTIGMIALLVFNIVIGIYSNRQLFGANLFAIILILRILPHHRFNCAFNILASMAVIAYWWLMATGIEDVKQQYKEIIHLHKESADGSVIIDRHRVMTLGFPLRAKYYEDILGQFNNDLHHSMMKDFKHVRKGKTLKLKPISSMVHENVEQYAPGHFNVTLKEPPKGEAPREVSVYGHYIFSNLKSAPRRLEVTKYSNRRPPYATAVIIPEYPFFTADSIIILPN